MKQSEEIQRGLWEMDYEFLKDRDSIIKNIKDNADIARQLAEDGTLSQKQIILLKTLGISIEK